MESYKPPEGMGCVAMLAATALAALLVTLGMSPDLVFYVPVFVVTPIIITLIATPLYLLALHHKCANLWTAIGTGFVTGSFFPAMGALGDWTLRAWFEAAAFGLAGMVGGLAFYLVATSPRAPFRNTMAMFVLAVASIVAALLTRPGPM